MHCEQPFAHDGAHDVVGIMATDCHTVQVFNSRNVPWEVVKLNCNGACQGCGSNDEDQIRSSLHASWRGTLSGA